MGESPANAMEVRNYGCHEDWRRQEHGIELHHVRRLRLPNMIHGDSQQLAEGVSGNFHEKAHAKQCWMQTKTTKLVFRKRTARIKKKKWGEPESQGQGTGRT
jgi:hypothetical protein